MALKPTLTLAHRFDQKVFDAIYARSLVYNACWEDPAVDREALALGPADRVLVITSAGCNVLDYALTGPARIHAVDANAGAVPARARGAVLPLRRPKAILT